MVTCQITTARGVGGCPQNIYQLIISCDLRSKIHIHIYKRFKTNLCSLFSMKERTELDLNEEDIFYSFLYQVIIGEF